MDNHLAERLKKAQETFDAMSADRSRRFWKHRYYYRKISDYYRFYIPEGSRVLEVGCGEGDLLAALKPSRGLGIDASAAAVETARRRHPGVEFRHAFAETFSSEEKFDYVILSGVVGYLDDVQYVLENLRRVCVPSTRVIIDYYNYLWEPALNAASALGVRLRQPQQNWLSIADLENLLHISGYDVIGRATKMAFPFYVPLVSEAVNRVVPNLPVLRELSLLQFVIARPALEERRRPQSVSVIVACKNEKGNIEEMMRRIPKFPAGVEVVCVDGRSTDGTREELERVKPLFPDLHISIYDQTGPPGKGHAVRQAFEKAAGDVFIILDADISVAPEDLTKFYELLVNGRGEFINGTRLVYPMEKQAMRFLNILGNKFFSLAFTFLLGQPMKDTLCGTKALFRGDYEKIAKNRAYFGNFDPFGDFDLLFGAAKLNLKIVEVPVRYYERRYGSTKIHRFRHGFLLLGMCFIAARRIKFV